MYIDRSRILTPRSDHRVSIVGALSRRQIRFHIDFTRPHEETEGNASDYRERIVTGNVCIISIFFPSDKRRKWRRWVGWWKICRFRARAVYSSMPIDCLFDRFDRDIYFVWLFLTILGSDVDENSLLLKSSFVDFIEMIKLWDVRISWTPNSYMRV